MNAGKSAPRVRVADLGRSPVMWLAFGLGTGLSPKAPGTVGTLPGILLGWLLVHVAAPWGQAATVGLLLAATAVLSLVGVYLCDEASRRLGVHDHGGIVFDEIVGVLPVFVVLPETWWQLVLIFVWFRVFDVIKPWPINWLDRRVGGGLGIMVDDLLAGGYALLATWATLLVAG
ncbi:phosphatidylglycerophosphatase A [Guyparkeria hydrothermalis]|uniref:phosphatidylglycerophosphatase A family protein n=1 Tax=Guyparkeria hydrothermalis TaxID=923 RepID=UPI0020215888|nr:phosphatidylglycerophosphatase A [Guyparkeria hydrothermalis]MCL7745349.1 phosphatidylglycerophosphatase A [Guyparkeria hydrothermalis]